MPLQHPPHLGYKLGTSLGPSSFAMDCCVGPGSGDRQGHWTPSVTALGFDPCILQPTHADHSLAQASKCRQRRIAH